MRSTLLGCVLICQMLSCGVSWGGSSISGTNRWSYGANMGWTDWYGDLTNGTFIGEFVSSGYLYSANCGWIHLGAGQPTNGVAYGNTATNDYGVNHDGRGNLRGHAYGANIGWLCFEDIGAPRVNLRTGVLSGHVYGSNIGWMSLSNVFAHVQTTCLTPGIDTDHDGIPDAWEMAKTGNLNTLRVLHDSDGDGMLDVDEYLADTNPTDSNDVLRVVGVSATGDADMVLKWSSKETRGYCVEANHDLTTTNGWDDWGLGILAPDAGAQTTRTIPAANGSNCFLRIKAMRWLRP